MNVSSLTYTWLLLLIVPKQLTHCSSWTIDNETYGASFICSTQIHIEKHTKYSVTEWDKHTYQAYAEANDITGATTKEHYNSRSDAKHMAVYLLYSGTNLHSCNCAQQSEIINGCEISIETCFTFKSSTDVAIKKVQYETWIAHLNYETHHCCDYNMTNSIENATDDFMNKYPSCFTTTTAVYLNSCEGCIKLDGKRCIDGYQLCPSNNDCCVQCPDGLAGHDGICMPCKWNQEPTYDHANCEQTPLFSIGLPVCVSLGVSVFSVLILVLLRQYVWKKYCDKKQSYQNNEVQMISNINEENKAFETNDVDKTSSDVHHV